MPTYFKVDILACVIRYLIDAAQDKRVVPYHELENIFGFSHNMAGYYAGMTGRYCQDNDLPLLNALVVNTTTCQPSDGFDSFLEDADEDDWGTCLANCWKFFHLTSSRSQQVKNFSGLTAQVRDWAEDLEE